MVWSKFTLKYYKQFKNIYNLKNNNKLLKSIRKERKLILEFININTNLNYTITILDNVLKTKIKDYTNGIFVYKEGIWNSIDTIPDEYLIEWGSNKIYIKTTKKQFDNLKSRLSLLITFLEYIKSKSNKQERILNIYLILTPLKKNIPNSDYITVPNVNSGYTDFMKNIIFIWRLEEFEKVLLHEVLHFFDMDCRDYEHHTMFNIDSGHNENMEERLYEAYTDFFAIYYHLIYLSTVTRVKIKKLLQLELSFICNQAQYVNAFFKLNDWNNTPTTILKQSTSAFSYYILKYLIFEYALNNNINSFVINNKIINKILSIGFKSKEYQQILSLRMTLLQLL